MDKRETGRVRIGTSGIQSQVLGPFWTLKHLRVLDLLHQQLQEVLSGCLAAQVAAGKRSLLHLFEAEQRDASISGAGRRRRWTAKLVKVT